MYLVCQNCLVLSVRAPSIGTLKSLHLRHDSPGSGPGWQVHACQVLHAGSSQTPLLHNFDIKRLAAVSAGAAFNVVTLEPYVRHMLSCSSTHRDEDILAYLPDYQVGSGTKGHDPEVCS